MTSAFPPLVLGRLVLGLALAASLSACGLKPMYAGGRSGAAAQALASVQVEPIPGKNGWLMRNALNDRLAAMGDAAPRFLLKVQLDDRIEGLGVRADDTVTRERRTLRARYQLVDTQDGKTVLDETSSWDAGIDVASSEYATVAAEDSALERLTEIVADRVLASVALAARE
ncbi:MULTISPECIES: LPS assembly lipoprotein LptE [unclassified Sphingobium]|uniref:LPS assembly lipoprotein LptE n=1 Tax=unclassified Sphingobium TaxID=2611147 RepID=UPI002224CB9F|nr:MULTISPECIES: LPS assembly lipoprotein LptE [unclassified Sphingobium]MCW2383455.1 LPS-assembly lipoprotein [Sphingobium sp. B2D3B]MCW2399570.1 LPS-assembly lipoprotein [Sphingobium sp. B2D3C]